MDFTTKQWFVGIIVLVIVAIIVDGIRRMRKARHDSLQMSLDPKETVVTQEKAKSYGSEFPNGGARPSQKSIDKNRIDQVRSQYDFGRDMSVILEEAKEKLSKETQDNDAQWQDDEDEDEYFTRPWDEEYEEPIIANHAIDDEFPEGHVSSPIRAAVDEPIHAPKKESQIEETATEEVATEKTPDNNIRVSEVEEVTAVTPQQPTQASLNLEESVPVLMDTVEEAQNTVKNSTAANSTETNSTVSNSVDSTESNLPEDSVEQADADVEQTLHAEVDLGDDVSIRSVGKHIKPAIEPIIEEENLETRSANKPKYQSKYFSSNVEQETSSTITEVLVINVRATKNQQLQGSDLLEQVLANGLRYGAMNIFHRHVDEDGEGPVLFSMANMLKPGTFDLKSIDHFTTVGVTFFLTLPVSDNQNMAAFETMLATAKNVASSLGAELNDDQRSIMTAQTMEHYRERIRDFARRQQLEKNKS